MIALQAACDFVCSQLSPPLFDLALDIVFKEVSSTARSNSARVVSQLVSCFARSNSAKTLKKYWRLCDTNIRLELEGGASSTRTTSTNNPIESDVTLHWWIGILTGVVTNSGEEVSFTALLGADFEADLSFSAPRNSSSTTRTNSSRSSDS